MSTQTTVMDWINDEVNNADKQMVNHEPETDKWIGFNAREGALDQVHDVIKIRFVDPIVNMRADALTTMDRANRSGDQCMADLASMKAETLKTALETLGYPLDDDE